MLCRVPKDVKDVQEAGKLIELARERAVNMGDEIIASIDLADGICKSVLALEGACIPNTLFIIAVDCLFAYDRQ